MKRIAVFCGSKMPELPIYREEAVRLAKYFSSNDIQLIYGGAKVGIMGLIADTMLDNGGYVIGVMPRVLADKEILHEGISEAILVKYMHERKATMMEMADGFIAFPGGCGTMEEIFEVITWNQIGIHHKPYGFLNVDHYYDGIKMYLDNAERVGFSTKEQIDHIIFESRFDDFIHKMESHFPKK
ncbi:TIGR00730 family Rossman fold protein [Erysipelothrix amsterdamensis]|uniref:Cytokinin riboside 5'-monophosphate phosphoribohydrolase n=1 Tax=Erysipelothrix amsterdamensis TaxID=2929157 RepID=A0AAU9VHD9_9FIRM|nr:TIGR00730 family Rossman fold protein [Erysipelothrix sp. A18Y020d]CAH2763787.1 TIGR00730 family Rossman fold protein [Erysipelothrix sp. A18Y020d]